MKKVEESVKKANRNLEKKQRSTEAILEQQRQARMQADGSSTLAQKFRHERQKVLANTKFTSRRRR
jgi:hypothetical protein